MSHTTTDFPYCTSFSQSEIDLSKRELKDSSCKKEMIRGDSNKKTLKRGQV
jgi:hypothetical protein